MDLSSLPIQLSNVFPVFVYFLREYLTNWTSSHDCFPLYLIPTAILRS